MPQQPADLRTTGRLRIPLPVRSALAALDLLSPPLAARLARTLYFRPRRLRARAAEGAILARGERFVVEDEGVPVVGRAWGAGPVVVLIHGWSGHLGQLTAFVEPLVAGGFRVVGFDWPAHGESQGSVASLVHAGRVLQGLQRLFGPFHGVVAHSFGAAAAVWAASEGLQVDRLVLLAPVGRIGGYVEAYAKACRFSERQKAAFLDSCALWLSRPFEAFEPALLAPALTQKALLFHSADDGEVSTSDVEALAAGLRAPLRRLDGLGHRRLLRDPSCIAWSVAFLGQSDAFGESWLEHSDA